MHGSGCQNLTCSEDQSQLECLKRCFSAQKEIDGNHSLISQIRLLTVISGVEIFTLNKTQGVLQRSKNRLSHFDRKFLLTIQKRE